MLKEKTLVIDDNEYTFYQFKATEGTVVLLELSKILGAPIGVLADGMKNAIAESGAKGLKEILDSDSSSLRKIAAKINISDAVRSLMENLEVQETMKLIKTLLKQVKVKNTEGNYVNVAEVFETHFQGEYVLLLKVIKEAINFQYGGFFFLFQNIKQIGSVRE